MKLLADYHVHSKYSKFFHAKNTIEEIVRKANAIGLKEIAITGHGFKHLCGTSKAKMREARKIIDEINEWSSTKVLLGIEANIISEDGTIDVDNETISMLDILLVGYHKMVRTDFASFFGKVEKSENAKTRCTRAFVNAINKYPITIISHLDSILTTDLYEIGKACKKNNTMIEINQRHTKWTKDQVDELVASDCMFVVNSDAHKAEDIGEVSKCFELIKKYEIPTETIANVEFELNERTQRDLEFETFKSLYKNQKEEAQENQTPKEPVYKKSLSDEMENALKEIAQKQGLNYKVIDDKPDAKSEINDESKMIDDAKDFIKTNTIAEFDAENEQLENVEVESLPENDMQVQEEIASETQESSEQIDAEISQISALKEEVKIEEKQEPKGALDVLNLSIKPNTKRKSSQTNQSQKSNTSSKTTQKLVIQKNESKSQTKQTKARGGFVGVGGIADVSDKK